MQRRTCRRFAWFFMAVVGVIAGSHADQSAIGQETKPVSLTVVTYNIRYDNAGDGENRWANRREAMVKYLRETGADLIGLQEVLPQQRAYLAEQLADFAWYGVGRDDDQDHGEGTPIFYRRERFELLAKGTFWLSPTPDKPGSQGWDAALPRIASWVKLRDKNSGSELLAINTHFDHRGPEARTESGKLIVRQIAELAASGERRLPVILTGDFNCRSSAAPYKAITEPEDPALKLLDAQHISREPHRGGDSTSNGFRQISPGSKIDYIFVRDVAGVARHQIDDPRVDGRFVSDHLPIVADVLLAPSKP